MHSGHPAVATRRRTVVAAILATLVAACSGGGSPPSPAPATTQVVRADLMVYAAASLEDVLGRVRAAYEAVVPGTTLTMAYGSSATLEAQIEQGAPADVFLAADTHLPQLLADGGLADGSPVPFAGNGLIVVVPITNPAGITTPAGLATPGARVIAAGDAVPVTAYAAALVANLAREPGYPASFAAAYARNIVSREDNAAALIARIELGEGDAAIVYVTDAIASGRVATIAVPSTAGVRATYAGVVVKGSRSTAAARAFLDWLAAPAGEAILAGSGFLPAR